MSNSLFDQVQSIQQDIANTSLDNLEALEAFRIKLLGSKNILKPLFAEIRNIEPARRKEFGLLINEVKSQAEEKYQALQKELAGVQQDQHTIDVTAPGEPVYPGARHPIAITLNRIIEIFAKIGFNVAYDREIEDDWHNFTSMNTPEDHPARDMQDTFYLKDSSQYLLRTHTSSVQSRVMTKTQPPIRIIAPGRVFRNETISARSHCQFHQVEGLYVDKGVSFKDMKQTLYYYAQEQYGKDVKIRLRPSFFPFTEPSAEMDVYWGLNNEHDYRITKGTGWLEILGCGMVDPNVLESCGIDSEKYTGFAFGMGIERQAMLKYKISDIRYLFENDVRFLNQFTSAL